MALRAAGTACNAVDIVMSNENTNVFSCTHPPGKQFVYNNNIYNNAIIRSPCLTIWS